MNPEFDAELARVKARLESGENRRSTPARPISDFTERFARLKLTPEQEAAAEEATRQIGIKAREKLETKWRNGDFNRICPDEFCQPWDWARCSARALLRRAELESVMAWDCAQKGLYVVGASGLCKTRAVWVLLRRLIVEEKRAVTFYDGSKFGNEASAAYAETGGTEAWVESLSKCPLLVIDDLGKRWTPAIEDAVFDIVNRRTNWHRPTILTTNYAGDDFRTMSAGRKDNNTASAKNIVDTIMRRVGDYFNVIEL